MGGNSLKIGTFLNFLDLYINYCRQIFAKLGTHGQITLFSPFFLGQNRDSPYEKGTVGKLYMYDTCTINFIKPAMTFIEPTIYNLYRGVA